MNAIEVYKSIYRSSNHTAAVKDVVEELGTNINTVRYHVNVLLKAKAIREIEGSRFKDFVDCRFQTLTPVDYNLMPILITLRSKVTPLTANKIRYALNESLDDVKLGLVELIKQDVVDYKDVWIKNRTQLERVYVPTYANDWEPEQ